MAQQAGGYDSIPVRIQRFWQVLITVAKDKTVIPYGESFRRADVPFNPFVIPRYLDPIANHCINNNWPNLAVLAVNRETREPGDRFEKFLPREQWAEETKRVQCFDWDEVPPPK